MSILLLPVEPSVMLSVKKLVMPRMLREGRKLEALSVTPIIQVEVEDRAEHVVRFDHLTRLRRAQSNLEHRIVLSRMFLAYADNRLLICKQQKRLTTLYEQWTKLSVRAGDVRFGGEIDLFFKV